MIIPQNPVLKSRQPLSWQAGSYGTSAVLYGVANYVTSVGSTDTIDVRVGDPLMTPVSLARDVLDDTAAKVATSLNTALNAAMNTTLLDYFTTVPANIGLGGDIIVFSDPITGKYVEVTATSDYTKMGFPIVASDARTFAYALGIADFTTLASGEQMTVTVGTAGVSTVLTVTAAYTSMADLVTDLNAQLNTGNGTTALDYFAIVPPTTGTTLMLTDPTTGVGVDTAVNVTACDAELGFVTGARTYTAALTASVPMSLNINGAPELSAFSASYAVPMHGLVGTDPNMVPSQSSASATKLSVWVHIVAEDANLDTDINFFTAWSNGTDGEVVTPTSFLDFTLTGKVGAHVFSGGIALAAFGIEEVGPVPLGPNNLPAMNTVLVYDVPAGATKFWFAPTYAPHGAAQPPSVVPVITVGVVPRAE